VLALRYIKANRSAIVVLIFRLAHFMLTSGRSDVRDLKEVALTPHLRALATARVNVIAATSNGRFHDAWRNVPQQTNLEQQQPSE
jgi:hypothetical protein